MATFTRNANGAQVTFADGTEAWLGVTVGILGSAPGAKAPFPAWFIGRETSSGSVAAVLGQRISMLTSGVMAQMRQEGDDATDIAAVVQAARDYVPELQQTVARLGLQQHPYSGLVRLFEDDLVGLQSPGLEVN